MAKRPKDDVDTITEPVQDPSLVSAVQTILTDETDGPIADAVPTRILRPSELVRLMEEQGFKGDPFRFLKDQGLPPPQRRYRVTGKGPVNKTDEELQPAELDAVDVTDAYRQFAVLRRVKQAELHRFRFNATILEE